MDLSILWASTHTAMSVFPHTHSFYQLIFPKTAGGYIGLDARRYSAQPHTVYLAKPGVAHSIDQCGRMNILEIKFNATGVLAERINRLPEQFCIRDLPIEESLLDRVSLEQTDRGPCFDEAASSAMTLFFIEAFRHFGIVSTPRPVSPTDPDTPEREDGDMLILQLKDYIEARLHEPLTLEQLARKVHFNKTYFVQRFKSLWGVPPMKYVSNLRCQKAIYLLMDTELPISNISEMTGFQSPHYFSAVFKRYTGQSPNDFRKLHAGETDGLPSVDN